MNVRVNDMEIPPAAIAAEVQNHPAPTPDAAFTAAAQALVVRELLLQEARRLGFTPAPLRDEDGRRETDEDALIRALLDDRLIVPTADDATCRRYYDNNPSRFRSPDIYEAAHILLSASPTDENAYGAATREAEAIIALLQQRPELFGDVARDRSDCPSGKDGGRLGQVTRGQTTPEFETFLVAIEAGQLCPVPVRTRYGVHVLRLDRKIEGQLLPFDAVRHRIATYLEEASWRRAASQYVRILIGQSRIEGLDLEGTADPLVQ